MPEVSNLLVVGMGVGVVFIGLICLILVCKIVSAIARIGGPAPATAKPSAPAPAPVAQVADSAIPNRQELVAAISVAIAREMGTEPSALRIVSLKKL